MHCRKRVAGTALRAGPLLVVAFCTLALPTYAQETPAAAATPAEIASKAAVAQINDLAFAGERLVAVGDKGIVVLSTDAKTWTQAPTPVDVLLNAVFFTNDREGWAVGHDATVIHTDDGGQTWTLQNWAPGDNRPFMDVYFWDDQRGLAVGAYGLFKITEDGGKNWHDHADPAFEEGPHLNSLTRTADGSLLLVGEKGLTATSVDGKAWVVHPTGYEGSLFAAIPRGEKGALVIGMRGTVLEAADMSCPAWRKVETGTEKSLFGLTDLGNGKVVVAGTSGELRVLNPGKSPEPIIPPAETGLNLSTTYTGLMNWSGRLVALTDRGVRTVPVTP